MLLVNDLLVQDNADCESDLQKNWQDFVEKPLDFNFYLTSSVVNSAQIEGNTLDLNSFISQSAAGEKNKQVTEIEDLRNAYELAFNLELTEKNLLKLHQVATQTLLGGQGGKYRATPVGVFSKNGLTYLAIEPEKVKPEMTTFFDEMRNLLGRVNTLTEAFYWASFIHLKFVHIHPFIDGNGRLARLLEKWFLAQVLDKKAWYIQSESYYFAHRNEYYQNINLGVNYYELDYSKALPFLEMLPKSLA